CRTGPLTPQRLEIAQWMIENGSDIHQGGDGPLMRAALSDRRIPMMELLVAHGADVNARWNGHYAIVLAPCETLAPQALKWLLDHGARSSGGSNTWDAEVSMIVASYCRDAQGKHACLEVFAQGGFEFPDTPGMAFHRGRLDLLQAHLKRDPLLLRRQLSE